MTDYTVSEFPLLMYLDASVLVAYCWEHEPHYAQAVQLIGLCCKHREKIQVHISRWTKIETHGTLYEKLLENEDGIRQETHDPPHKWAGKSPRTYRPVLAHRLQQAKELLEGKCEELDAVCDFHVEDPDDDPDLAMRLTEEIAEESALYPPDSLHIAISIRRGCVFLVTDDVSFLETLATPPFSTVLQAKLEVSLHHPRNPPTFEALPLVPLARPRVPLPERSIFDRLETLGLT